MTYAALHIINWWWRHYDMLDLSPEDKMWYEVEGNIAWIGS